MDVDKDSNSLEQLRALLASGESNEDLVLQITDLFPALIYVYDAENRKLRYINRRITELLGYEWDDLHSWDNDLRKMIFREDVELVEKELEKYYQLEGHSSYAYNCRLLHKGGDFRYFKTVGTVLRRNEKGAPLSMLFMAQDITAQMEVEQEKLRAFQMMEEAEKMLLTGMWKLHLPSRKMEWSDGMYALTGYTREDLPEVDLSLFLQHLNTAETEKLEQHIREAVRTGREFSIDFSFHRKDGTRIFIHSIGKPVMDAAGRVQLVSGINRDISDQYLQNLEYKANKELQKQTEQMLNYGVFVWDMVADTTQWSNGLRDIFEMDPSDSETAINTPWYEKHIAEEDLPRLRAAIKHSLETHADFDCDYTITTEKGNIRMVSSKGHIVLDDQQKPVRMVGNTRDITSFKKTENELKRNLRELNRSNMELEEFAYAASHDLQEPLRKITTFGSRLKSKYSGLLGEEGQLYIERMQAAAENMRILIDNLLELSRVSRNTQVFVPTDLGLMVKEALSDLELTIDETGAEIRLDPLPIIDGIPSQLRQMFTNLIGNALKFRKAGQQSLVVVRATKLHRKEKEEYYLLPDRNYYRIDIVDNGIGFDQEYEARIFQIFQRLHGKSEYPGSGIGLSICKRIAERHRGMISAVGKEGEGATFSIILPENQ